MMNLNYLRNQLRLLLGLLLAISAGAATATLGQAPSVAGAGAASAAVPATKMQAVTPGQGPVLPDLSALLGTYFNTFKLETERARAAGRRGGPVNIVHPDLVSQSGGRMRNFFGHAYAPALIPAGLNIKDVLQ
jgi:hypothetical protein